MTKSIKRTLMVLIAFVLLLSMGGCAKPVDATPEPSMEPVPTAEVADSEEYPEISLILRTDTFVMESWPVMQELFKMARCNAVIKTVRPLDHANKVARTLASGEPKDLVQVDAAHGLAARDVLVNVAPFISEKAPNYYLWSQSYPEIWNALSTNTGEIFVFPMRENSQRIEAMAFVAPDVTASQTLDSQGLHSLLQNKLLSVDGDSTRLCEMMAPFYGTSIGSMMVGDQAVFGPTHESFKNMLNNLNLLYKANKLEKEIGYSTRAMHVQAVEDGRVALAICPEDEYEWIHSKGYRPIMLNLGEGAYLPSRAVAPESYGAISNTSGKTDDVIRFLETCFSPDGRQLLNSGIHGQHVMRFEDGRLDMLSSFAHAGTYQWHEQGLTPEGVPGIYYNEWSRFEMELFDQLLPMKSHAPDSQRLIAKMPIHGAQAKTALLAEVKLKKVYHKWWTAFIVGEKSVVWDWSAYLAELRQAGLNDWVRANYGQHVQP